MVKYVKCDIEIDGNGWMTFQRSFDGNIKIHDKTWEEYKNGFGTPKGEFWLGNDFLNEILKMKRICIDSISKKLCWMVFILYTMTYNSEIQMDWNF